MKQSPRDSTEAHFALTSACPRRLMMAFTNNVSLNANTNVRNCLNEKYIPPGGLRLKRKGGCSVDMFWMSGLERNEQGGGRRTAWGVRVRWGYALSRLNKGGLIYR